MKRILTILTVMLSISLSSFAKGDDKVSPVVLESFKTSFKQATEVDWTVKEDMYKAQFNLEGQYITAFYNCDGKMVAMTRNIATTHLPISLQTSLKAQIEDLWITDLFEISNEEGTSYYVTLENADTKQVLKASANGEWSNYQKQRKS
jgi:hypothetical protein